MSPLIEALENPYEDFKIEIRKQMELILKYYDCVNTRSLAIQKEIQNLHYILDLRKSKSMNTVDDDVKVYESRQKMYLNKLVTNVKSIHEHFSLRLI